MYYFKHLSLLFMLIPAFFATNAQVREFKHPQILSFEESTSPVIAGEGSKVSLSDKHYKHITSIRWWKWDQPNAQILIIQPRGYKTKKTHQK